MAFDLNNAGTAIPLRQVVWIYGSNHPAGLPVCRARFCCCSTKCLIPVGPGQDVSVSADPAVHDVGHAGRGDVLPSGPCFHPGPPRSLECFLRIIAAQGSRLNDRAVYPAWFGCGGARTRFRQHAAELSAAKPEKAATPICVAIDGKTLRGSFDAFNDRRAAHVLGAFATDGQIILGHMTIAEKSNEIPAAQEMIATLGLSGRLFTLDAMHTQKSLP